MLGAVDLQFWRNAVPSGPVRAAFSLHRRRFFFFPRPPPDESSCGLMFEKALQHVLRLAFGSDSGRLVLIHRQVRAIPALRASLDVDQLLASEAVWRGFDSVRLVATI